MTCLLAIAMASSALVHGMALATPPRGQAELHEIVICAAGAGEAVITIDAQGNRVTPSDEECAPWPCPDCLPCVSFALPASNPAADHRAQGESHAMPFRSLIHPQRPYAHSAARGPPNKV